MPAFVEPRFAAPFTAGLLSRWNLPACCSRWRRTPFMEPAALKIADGALVTVAGIFLGFVLGGRSSRVFTAGPSLPVRPPLGAGAILLLSQVTPSPLSRLLPLGLAIADGIWAVCR